MSTDYQVEIGDSVALVNMVLERFGQPMVTELPNATYGDPAACLYYRALSHVGCTGVNGQNISFASERQAALVAELWGVDRHGNEVVAPSAVRVMVAAFDGDMVPQYNIDR